MNRCILLAVVFAAFQTIASEKGIAQIGNIFSDPAPRSPISPPKTAAGQPSSTQERLWSHNGSTFYLVAQGRSRKFFYKEPRLGLQSVGVKPDTLLFDGEAVGDSYRGTARIFSGSCGQLAYPVSGPILDDYRRVELHGNVPRVDSNCRVIGYGSNVLEFRLIDPTAPDAAATSKALAERAAADKTAAEKATVDRAAADRRSTEQSAADEAATQRMAGAEAAKRAAAAAESFAKQSAEEAEQRRRVKELELKSAKEQLDRQKLIAENARHQIELDRARQTTIQFGLVAVIVLVIAVALVVIFRSRSARQNQSFINEAGVRSKTTKVDKVSSKLSLNPDMQTETSPEAEAGAKVREVRFAEVSLGGKNQGPSEELSKQKGSTKQSSCPFCLTPVQGAMRVCLQCGAQEVPIWDAYPVSGTVVYESLFRAMPDKYWRCQKTDFFRGYLYKVMAHVAFIPFVFGFFIIVVTFGSKSSTDDWIVWVLIGVLALVSISILLIFGFFRKTWILCPPSE